MWLFVNVSHYWRMLNKYFISFSLTTNYPSEKALAMLLFYQYFNKNPYTIIVVVLWRKNKRPRFSCTTLL